MSNINVTYQVYAGGKWLPNVTNLSDYAGIYGTPIQGVYANLSSGSIKYKVHTQNGSWLPWVSDRNDYAGILGQNIDALQMKITGLSGCDVRYRSYVGGRWLPWVTGTEDYAGILGQAITAIQVEIISGNNSGIVSDRAVDFIKSYEGFSATQYYCSSGVLTIGYGSTSGWIMNKSRVTEEATRALKEDVTYMAGNISRDLNSRNITLKQYEFDSLASFAYNCGVSGLLNSTLYSKICSGVIGESLKPYFQEWCKGNNGQVIQGLVNRRLDEFEMFAYGDYVRNY